MTSFLLQIAGLITVSIGISLIWVPAGIISAGIAIILIGLALEKSK